MEVLIVSKTHMATMACVGGLLLSDNRYVRLLNPGNYNQDGDTEFDVGDIWDIDFMNRTDLHPPHIEDVIVTSQTFIRKQPNLSTFLRTRRVIDWTGHINNIFDGLLHWTNSGTGFIPEGGTLPRQSVGFWLTNSDLTKAMFKDKIRYRFPNGMVYRGMSYVGYQESIDVIPSGTILRVSMSRIFPPMGQTEITTPRGFYLQLSGWYTDDERLNVGPVRRASDDLPF